MNTHGWRAIFAITCLIASFSILDPPRRCLELRQAVSKKAFEQSAAVFAGRVTSIQQDNYGKIMHFNTKRAWKGISDNIVTVTTASMSGSCGYDFEQGKEYLVYSYDTPLIVNPCGRTQDAAHCRRICRLGSSWPELRSNARPATAAGKRANDERRNCANSFCCWRSSGLAIITMNRKKKKSG